MKLVGVVALLEMKEKMIAEPLVKCYGDKINVKEADQYIKRIDSRAEYYYDDYTNDAVGMFVPTSDDGNEWNYMINNSKYRLIFTSSYKKLVETYTEQKRLPEQLNLWEV